MEKRELIAMLMESPFYFDLHLRERLGLLKYHQERFSLSGQTGRAALPDNRGLDAVAGTKGPNHYCSAASGQCLAIIK
jgi:hypothetical protein